MDRLNTPVQLPNPASNITYNSANQMLAFNDKSITYDANGNMETITNSCGTTTYTWDVRNRLVGIQGFNADCSTLTASFKYDALGRRIQKTITHTDTYTDTMYLYDGLDIVQEIENGTVTANYIRTLNIDEPLARIKSDGTIRYYQQDAFGSVVGLTTENGQLATTYHYDPFGNTTVVGEPSDNPFQYTGRENDGTGLYYYRARYYSPELQRFISEDPVGFEGGDANLFAYVGNNPVNWIDPEGRCPETFITEWRYKTIGPNKATNYDSQSQEKSRYQGSLLSRSGKCDPKCKEDRIIECEYIVDYSWYRRTRSYNKKTKKYGTWTNWVGHGFKYDGVATLAFSCKEQQFVGGISLVK